MDAIQAAVLETKSDRLDAATLKALPAVQAFIEKLEKERADASVDSKK